MESAKKFVEGIDASNGVDLLDIVEARDREWEGHIEAHRYACEYCQYCFVLVGDGGVNDYTTSGTIKDEVGRSTTSHLQSGPAVTSGEDTPQMTTSPMNEESEVGPATNPSQCTSKMEYGSRIIRCLHLEGHSGMHQYYHSEYHATIWNDLAASQSSDIILPSGRTSPRDVEEAGGMSTVPDISSVPAGPSLSPEVVKSYRKACPALTDLQISILEFWKIRGYEHLTSVMGIPSSIYLRHELPYERLGLSLQYLEQFCEWSRNSYSGSKPSAPVTEQHAAKSVSTSQQRDIDQPSGVLGDSSSRKTVDCVCTECGLKFTDWYKVSICNDCLKEKKEGEK